MHLKKIFLREIIQGMLSERISQTRRRLKATG
jgi:hypothetical protein